MVLVGCNGGDQSNEHNVNDTRCIIHQRKLIVDRMDYVQSIVI